MRQILLISKQRSETTLIATEQALGLAFLLRLTPWSVVSVWNAFKV